MLKKRQLSALQRQKPNFILGAQGESRAVSFLVSLQYQILDQNVRLGTHEIDIIARDPETNELVFVEVKTRSTDAFGSPARAVTRKKIASMNKVARTYKRIMHFFGDFRFDILALLPERIDHYKNISWNF